MSAQVTSPHKLLNVVLDRVSADPGRFGGLADCYPPVRPGELEIESWIQRFEIQRKKLASLATSTEP